MVREPPKRVCDRVSSKRVRLALVPSCEVVGAYCSESRGELLTAAWGIAQILDWAAGTAVVTAPDVWTSDPPYEVVIQTPRDFQVGDPMKMTVEVTTRHEPKLSVAMSSGRLHSARWRLPLVATPLAHLQHAGSGSSAVTLVEQSGEGQHQDTRSTAHIEHLAVPSNDSSEPSCPQVARIRGTPNRVVLGLLKPWGSNADGEGLVNAPLLKLA